MHWRGRPRAGATAGTTMDQLARPPLWSGRGEPWVSTLTRLPYGPSNGPGWRRDRTGDGLGLERGDHAAGDGAHGLVEGGQGLVHVGLGVGAAGEPADGGQQVHPALP